MTPGFWRNKKVFVTGNTGFKGSWLSLWLARLGAEVRGYSLAPPTDPSLFERAGVAALVPTVIADIRDRDRLARELGEFQPDIVLHLAAQTVVFQAYEDPIETFSTNVVGTATVLECIRRLGRGCVVVNVTTDKVYENQQWVWGYRENDRLGGHDPYAGSKSCAELVAHAYRESFFAPAAFEKHGVGLANARAGNVIGGGDWTAWQLIPEAAAAFAQGKPVVLRHPAAFRPWQHMLDCLSGYLTLAEFVHADPRRHADNWNFGPPESQMQPVSRVVEILARHYGISEAWTQDSAVHPREDMALCLNSQKANNELHWGCRLPLEEALAWIASWCQRHAGGEGARALCEEQIERYMALPIRI